MKRFLLLCVTFSAFATSMHAVEGMPPGRWWKRPEVVQQLGLTSAQQTKLDELFRAHAEVLIDLKAEAGKQALRLRGELDQRTLDRARVRAAAEQVSAARARLFERELMMLVDMRSVLSDEQWERFRSELENRVARKRGRPGSPRREPRRAPGKPRPRP